MSMSSEEEEQHPDALRTPPPRNKRLPKELWGTKEARERKRALARERAKRRRARVKEQKKLENRKRTFSGSSSSDAAEACETELPPPEPDRADTLQDELPIDVDNMEEPYQQAAYTQEDRTIFEERATCLLQTTHKSPRRELVRAGDYEDVVPISVDCATSSRQARDKALDELSKSLARIKISSNISESAMNQLMQLFAEKGGEYRELLDNGDITASYSGSIKPKLLKSLPSFQNSILLKVEDTAKGYYYEKIEGLVAIPEEYFTLPPNGNKRLLRTECSALLKDIKELYLETHGGRSAANLQHLQNIALSADGVQESKKGSTTFLIVSIRINNCIYLAHMFDVRIGVAESKPSPIEWLRYKFFILAASLLQILHKPFVSGKWCKKQTKTRK